MSVDFNMVAFCLKLSKRDYYNYKKLTLQETSGAYLLRYGNKKQKLLKSINMKSIILHIFPVVQR